MNILEDLTWHLLEGEDNMRLYLSMAESLTNTDEIIAILSSRPANLTDRNGEVMFIYTLIPFIEPPEGQLMRFIPAIEKRAIYNVSQFRTQLDIIGAINSFYEKEYNRNEIIELLGDNFVLFESETREKYILRYALSHLNRDIMFYGLQYLGGGVYKLNLYFYPE